MVGFRYPGQGEHAIQENVLHGGGQDKRGQIRPDWQTGMALFQKKYVPKSCGASSITTTGTKRTLSHTIYTKFLIQTDVKDYF